MLKRSHALVLTAAVALFVSPVRAEDKSDGIQITPSSFDFGWSPDNTVVNADFHVKNVGAAIIPLTSVLPSCGCTAADFTPSNLSSDQESLVRLNFNTHGYTGLHFHKTATVKAGSPEKDYAVELTGVVADPNFPVLPGSNGIAAFEKNGAKKQTISVANKTGQTITLKMVQAPATWASFKPRTDQIAANASGDIDVALEGSTDADKTTSATFEVTGASVPYRFTVAARVGAAPEPYRKIRPLTPAPMPKATPANGVHKQITPKPAATPAK